jgi:hypothetical protein
MFKGVQICDAVRDVGFLLRRFGHWPCRVNNTEQAKLKGTRQLCDDPADQYMVSLIG